MNTQTLNYLNSIRQYAQGEFVNELNNIETMTATDIQRVANDQASEALDQAEYQDGVIVEDLDRDEIVEIFAAAINARMPSISTAFEAFMSDEKAVEQAIDNSTSASHGGGSYKVELFNDGTYRVLSSNQIGNLYNTPGIIISIPTLRDDEMAVLDDDDNEVVGAMYDNAIEELRRNFEYAISES